MRLYTHPKLIISIEENGGIKYFKEIWKGIINTVVFRDLMNKTISFYEVEIPKLNNGTDKIFIISDSRGVELIRSEDIDWVIEEIDHKRVKIGITHQAIIPSRASKIDHLADHYIMNNNHKKDFSNFLCDNEEDGIEWFLNSIDGKA